VDCVRGSDTVSRQGGDEFVVLSEEEDSEDASITARRMQRAVAEAHFIDQHDLHITCSVGVSLYPDDGLNAETQIKNADTAMYQAKENGRQTYQFFEPAMNIRAVERQSIEESLRRALEQQKFVVHYRPKINLHTGEITGAEALLRWTYYSRPGFSGAVYSRCGRLRPDSAHRHLGSPSSLPAGPYLGGCGPAYGHYGGGHLSDAIARGFSSGMFAETVMRSKSRTLYIR
jgi:hypothetical protein